MSSPCDTCRDPGACCRDFQLSRDFPVDATRAKVQDSIVDGYDLETGEVRFEAYPNFIALHPAAWQDPEKPDTLRWAFSCLALGEDGRCQVYDERPEVCRIFEPKSSRLCVEYEEKS